MSSLTSSPLGSPSGSPSSSVILTPGAKVKALLAQFDSDSEADSGESRKLAPAAEATGLNSPTRHASNLDQPRLPLPDEEDEDDDIPVAPRGRLAARMQASNLQSHQQNSSGDDETSDAYTRIRRQLLRQDTTQEREGTHKADSASQTPDAPRRRLLKRKSSPSRDCQSKPTTSRSVSPLFFPSPSPSKRARPSGPQASSEVHTASEVDSEDDGHKKPNPRFMALVQKQRQKRLEQEAAEAQKKAERLRRLREQQANWNDDDSDSDADGTGEKLTQHARPTRKASRKAVEEMHRETQRMSRNMQLTHQAQTKKKITKESLFAKFNFALPGAVKEPTSSTTASSAPNSDGEGNRRQATPPTSPLREDEQQKGTLIEATVPTTTEAQLMREAEDVPSLEDLMTQPAVVTKPEVSLDKGKGRAIEQGGKDGAISLPMPQEKKTPRAFRVRVSAQDIRMRDGDLSDDDLEIVTSQSSRRKIAVFENIPKRKAQETVSHLILRTLAQMNDDTRIRGKKLSSMNAAELEIALRKQARIQAAKERAEKIEELKAKGIFVQTAEERDKEQQEIEDLVERARQEAAQIQKKEIAKAKKNGTYEGDDLDDEDEDDGDYEGDEDVQLSEFEDGEDHEEGDEEDEDDSGDDSEEGESIANKDDKLVDEEASETDSEGDEDNKPRDQENEEPNLENVNPVHLAPVRRPRVQRAVVDSDDEDGNAAEHDQDMAKDIPSHTTPRTDTKVRSPTTISKTPTTINHSAKKIIPGLPMSDDLPIGLTQAFAATMADSQSQEAPTTQQDSFEMIRDLPDPQLSTPSFKRLDSIDVVSDSQPASQTQLLGLNLSFTQGFEQNQIVAHSPMARSTTQMSEIPDPTQDVGYILSPFEDRRFDSPLAPHSTIDTVIIPTEESPLVKRNGRLRRGFEVARAASSDEEASQAQSVAQPASAFEKMRKAAQRKAQKEAYDRNRSNAKEAVDEAAEESEDEYAGLGGASDDDAGEEDEDDRKMINDANNEKVNERKLAALIADKERTEDSAAVAKLLQDITTGRLRRKRGAGGFDDLDLSDEESAHARRREAKRREFAKMKRELLINSDERIGKIANDPKKNAFLQAIEDQDDEEELVIDLEYHEINEESQSQSQNQDAASIQVDHVRAISHNDPSNQPRSEETTKQPLEPSRPGTLNRPVNSTNIRRKGVPDRRPQTLAEIRESVSFLMEDPTDSRLSLASDGESDPEMYENLDQKDADAFADALDQVDEDDDDMDDFIVQDEQPAAGEQTLFKKPSVPASRAPYSERRTKPRGPVVDRLSLLRQSSSSSSASASTSGNGKMAFFTSSAGSNSSFKVPSLLRRATTNSSSSFSSDGSMSATGVTTLTERGAAGTEKEMIRRGTGGQKSSVGYYRNSRVQQREEQMRRRLVGKGRDGTDNAGGGSARNKIARGGLLGSLVQRGSWE